MDVDKPTDEEISKEINNVFNHEGVKFIMQKMTSALQGGSDLLDTVTSTSSDLTNVLKTAVQQESNKVLTRSENVKIFTEESKGEALPNHPRKMTRAEVLFSVKMVVEELQELLVTINNEGENVKELLIDIVAKSNSPTFYNKGKSDLELIAEQVDAFVDIDYYNCNAAAKAGFNVDDVFNLVHQANMSKKFDDGTFHKNEEGKVIKPQGWVEPDVKAVVSNWIETGTWTKK